jgi:hypothetical protein
VGNLPPITRCKSCGASVLFVKHATSGKWMPMDAEPLKADGPGQFAIIFSIAWPYGDAERAEQLDRYVSHFSTCPHAREWRQGKLL